MRNFRLCEYVAPVAKLALGGECIAPDADREWCGTFYHAELPIGLCFGHRDYGAYARKIECQAVAGLAINELARKAGRGHVSLSYYTAERYQDRSTPQRSISIERFETCPEKVARELQTHVIEPAKIAAFKALADMTDAASAETRISARVAEICERHGLKLHSRNIGGEYQFYGLNMNGRLYNSSGDGRIELSVSLDELDKLCGLIRAARE